MFVFLQDVNVLVVDEYIRRVYNTILSSPDILALGPGIGENYLYSIENRLVNHWCLKLFSIVLLSELARRRLIDN